MSEVSTEVERSHASLVEETERLASHQYSIETQARIETLLWVLGIIDTEQCPTGAVDDQRVRELTNRGPWPFDPLLKGGPDATNASRGGGRE